MTLRTGTKISETEDGAATAFNVRASCMEFGRLGNQAEGGLGNGGHSSQGHERRFPDREFGVERTRDLNVELGCEGHIAA